MEISEIKHKYKKYKQYSKVLEKEITNEMDKQTPNIGLIAKMNGELEKLVILMKIHLKLLNE
jgi:hypothetical protein